MTTIIRRDITLEPQYFDTKIKDHLLDKIRKETLNECTQKYGYILSVSRLVKIVSNYISSAASEIVFTVEFEADTVKPEIGNEITACVCMVFSEGLLAEVNGKLKILIPMHYIDGYTLVRNTLVKGDICIEKGINISVIITSTKYNDNMFSCIAKLGKCVV